MHSCKLKQKIEIQCVVCGLDFAMIRKSYDLEVQKLSSGSQCLHKRIKVA